MLYTDLTKKALNVAYCAHQGQIDKGGCPYVFHPYHIAEQMDTEDEVCVALLHDVLEDSNIDVDYLKSLGFSKRVIDAVIVLTRDKDCSYYKYINKVCKNKLSKKIKRADLIHNLDLSRLNCITEKDIERQYIYQCALDMLT